MSNGNKNRRTMNRRQSERSFKNNAGARGTHPMNLKPRPWRGGTRL